MHYAGRLTLVCSAPGPGMMTANILFDRILLDAAKRWQYQPALRIGAPVRYRKAIQITIQPN